MSSYVTISHSELSLSRAPVLSYAHCSHCAKAESGEETYPIYVMIHFQDRLSFASLWNDGFGAGAREPQVELSKWSCDF